jgi:hypothetical protein
MKKTLTLIAALYSAGAFAQSGPPPAPAGGKPPTHAKSHGAPKSIAEKLLACLEIDDATKDRLDCYDAIVSPKPKPKSTPANGVMDCRFVKEEDERLTCFNGFAEKIPKFSR